MSAKDVHQLARSMILDRAGGAINPENAVWLETHLEECASCTRYADAAGQAIQILRGMSEMPSPALVRATQRSVRVAARNLGDAASQRRMLIVSCILAAVWGAAMQPYLWRLSGWAGSYLGLPDPAWQAAFLATWLVPGIVSALLLTHLPLPSWLRGTDKERNT